MAVAGNSDVREHGVPAGDINLSIVCWFVSDDVLKICNFKGYL